MPLWVACLCAFVVLLSIALLVFLVPALRRDKSVKQQRLAEIGRYRVLGVRATPDVAEEPSDQLAALRPVVDRAIGLARRFTDEKEGRRSTITDRLERAGLRMRPEEWVALQGAIIFTGGFVGLVLINIFAGVAGALLGWFGCWYFRRFKTVRRSRAFEDQLADSLHLLASSLRAGLTLNSAMGALAREGIEPVSSEIARALQEVRLGSTLEEALDGVVRRTGSADMALVTTALRTVREVGGNLAGVLQTTAATMRERTEIRGQVQTLSAEGRFSAKVLFALPLLMAGYLFAFKREYLKPLYTTGGGIAALVTGGLLLLVGSLWLSRLTKIEV